MWKRPVMGLIFFLLIVTTFYVGFWGSEEHHVSTVAKQELQQRYHTRVTIKTMNLSYPMPKFLIYLLTPFSNDHKWWVDYETPNTHDTKSIIISKDIHGRWAVISR